MTVNVDGVPRTTFCACDAMAPPKFDRASRFEDSPRRMDARGCSGPADRPVTMGRLTAMWTVYRRHRFAVLFATLLLTLGAGYTLEALLPRQNPLQILVGLNLVAAVASVAREGDMRVPFAIGGAYLITRGLLATMGVPAMLAVSEALWVTAIVLGTVTAVRHAFGRGVVDAERILAALDGYLLAGLLFGFAYLMVDRWWPSSFGGTTTGIIDQGHAIYFSYVTLATLGYGDVVPSSPPARGLAIVEGIAGQMYLTVLVARLVSLYARDRED